MTAPVLVPLRGMFPGGNTGQAGLIGGVGGTQAAATALPATVNRIETLISADDSVILPSALPGTVVFVINATASELSVFGQASNAANPIPTTGDTIAPAATSTQAATATGVKQPAHALGIYVCSVVGQWKQGLMVS